jgi:hypothetical protein
MLCRTPASRKTTARNRTKLLPGRLPREKYPIRARIGTPRKLAAKIVVWVASCAVVVPPVLTVTVTDTLCAVFEPDDPMEEALKVHPIGMLGIGTGVLLGAITA